MAVLFAGLAGAASAVQAYISWETRGEVSRAIVFSERIDACAQVIAALQPFHAKAREEARSIVAGGDPAGRYSLPAYYYGAPAASPAFNAQHAPRLDRLRIAAASAVVVLPSEARDSAAYFETALSEDMAEATFFSQDEMLAWLERLDDEVNAFTALCRRFLDAPPASAGEGLPWW